MSEPTPTSFERARLAFRAVLGDAHDTAAVLGSPVLLDGVVTTARDVEDESAAFGAELALVAACADYVEALHVAAPLLARRVEDLADRVEEAARSYESGDAEASASFDELHRRAGEG